MRRRNKKWMLIVLCQILFLSIVQGQKISFISSEDSEPIPNVRIDVFVGKESFYYTADIEGIWIIDSKLKNYSTCDLLFSFQGFKSKEIKHFSATEDVVVTLTPLTTEFEEIAITAQYKTQRVDNAVHNIKIVDRQKLESMAAQDVKDALANETNIRFTEDNILGSGIQMQGIGGENVKILIDGVPLTGKMNGSIDLSQIPVDNVERIEIVEGPLSVSYGTDALAGTINIIMKKNQNKKFEAYSNNYFESSGKMNNTLGAGWQLKKHQIRLEGGRYFFDGWNPSHTTFHFIKKQMADSTRVMEWKPKIQEFGNFNYRYNRQKTVFNVSGRFLNEDIINKGYPRAPYGQTAFDDYYNTKRIDGNASFLYRFENNYRLSLMAGYSGYLRRKNTMIRDLTEISDVLSSNLDDHDTSQYHDIIARGQFTRADDSRKFNYELGFDILYQMTHGRRIIDGSRSVGDYAFFLTGEYSPIQTLTFRPGLRYGYNSEFRMPLTPSLNIKYNLLNKVRNKMTVRASYARGFRSPSIKEQYYTFIDANHNIVGNKDLKAEMSNNASLSLHHSLALNEIRMRNKISFFYNDIHDMIALAQNEAETALYSYFNLNRFISTGFQLETHLGYKNLSVGAGLGYIGRYNELDSDASFSQTDFLFSPEVSFNLQYAWEKIGVQFSAFYKYSGVLPQITSNEQGEFSVAILENYHLADVFVSKYIWKKRIKLTVGVKNLFDVRTIEGSEGGAVISAHGSGAGRVSVGMGRTYNIGVKIQLNSK